MRKTSATKSAGFVAAGSGANFEDDVAFVVGILRQQQEFQFGLALRQALFEARRVPPPPWLSFPGRVSLANHGPRFADAAFEIFVFADTLRRFRRVAVGFRSLLVALAVRDDFRDRPAAGSVLRSELRRCEVFDEQIGGR